MAPSQSPSASEILPAEIPFREFPKLPRLSRDCVITEKIDGTNASIFIEGSTFLVGSRTRWITPEDDNFGFARWAHAHREELLQLGDGHHFGEWWGAGIQRKYGLKEKRFSLFNVGRWCTLAEHGTEFQGTRSLPPACCGVVPTLYSGPFDTPTIEQVLHLLATFGSAAAPGFDDPEGIVIYHTAAQKAFKKTIRDDASPKSLLAANKN